MAYPKINVRDNEAWGKLVKTWATGRNYVDHHVTEEHPVPTSVESTPTYPKPTSFAEFAVQATRARVGLFFEDDDQTPVLGDEPIGFVVLQADSDTSLLKLPAKDKIEASEQDIMDGEQYALPQFYSRVFGRDVDPAQVRTKVQRLRLHAERVGEYTINTCH